MNCARTGENSIYMISRFTLWIQRQYLINGVELMISSFTLNTQTLFDLFREVDDQLCVVRSKQTCKGTICMLRRAMAFLNQAAIPAKSTVCMLMR